MSVHPEWGYDEMSVKIDGSRAEEAIAFIKQTWESNINYPFDYSFLDDHFERLYRSDKQMSSVVTIMAVLAILISCMGLFGLAAITTVRKTKEIGIRKVLGATEAEITILLSKNFALLIAIAFAIAAPIAWYSMHQWLQDYAYRINISWWLFAAGGLVAIIIALATISFQAMKAAKANPVKSLRAE